MENLEPYLDKFSESGRHILESALDETRRRNQHLISPEHILYALMEIETELFNTTMRELSIDPQKMRLAVEKRLENSRTHTGEGFRIAPETIDIFKYSMDRARSYNRRVIEPNDLLYTFAAYRLSPLNDILQNSESDIPKSSIILNNRAESQRRFLSQLQVKPSNFLTEFSLEELIKHNTSGLLLASRAGNVGSASSVGNSEQTTHNKYESLSYQIKPADSNKFDEKEFISSLGKEVEDSIQQSGLRITETDNPNSSNFHIEYKSVEMKGEVDISGEIENGYYKLTAMIVEKSNPKMK